MSEKNENDLDPSSNAAWRVGGWHLWQIGVEAFQEAWRFYWRLVFAPWKGAYKETAAVIREWLNRPKHFPQREPRTDGSILINGKRDEKS